MIHFPISGVETYWWVPILFTFTVSLFSSTGGVSGAFLLLPFQMSVLGFTGPAVSATNLLYNVCAIPSGVYSYVREKRMLWALAGVTLMGTLPGVIIGAVVRVKYMPDPKTFKFFAGLVLLYIAVRLVIDLYKSEPAQRRKQTPAEAYAVTDVRLRLKKISYVFDGQRMEASVPGLLILSLLVGIVGGIYGIGGGAILAPLFVTVFRLKVHTIAGAALFGTFATSVVGLLSYTFLAPIFSVTGEPTQPDWLLGLFFAVGGALGMFIGARLQRHLSAAVIKVILCVILLFVAGKYILQFFV